ncbi:hypothetical protein LBMAG53_37300 [Planctomycetota bacterium]|nr:hypothetical protein LBMAG53_37300 [Planctomycetota bacterium]
MKQCAQCSQRFEDELDRCPVCGHDRWTREGGSRRFTNPAPRLTTPPADLLDRLQTTSEAVPLTRPGTPAAQSRPTGRIQRPASTEAPRPGTATFTRQTTIEATRQGTAKITRSQTARLARSEPGASPARVETRMVTSPETPPPLARPVTPLPDDAQASASEPVTSIRRQTDRLVKPVALPELVIAAVPPVRSPPGTPATGAFALPPAPKVDGHATTRLMSSQTTPARGAGPASDLPVTSVQRWTGTQLAALGILAIELPMVLILPWIPGAFLVLLFQWAIVALAALMLLGFSWAERGVAVLLVGAILRDVKSAVAVSDFDGGWWYSAALLVDLAASVGFLVCLRFEFDPVVARRMLAGLGGACVVQIILCLVANAHCNWDNLHSSKWTAEYAEDIMGTKRITAADWLAQGKPIAGLEPDVAARLVQDLTAAGAQELFIGNGRDRDLKDRDGSALVLVVRLSDDQAERRQTAEKMAAAITAARLASNLPEGFDERDAWAVVWLEKSPPDQGHQEK